MPHTLGMPLNAKKVWMIQFLDGFDEAGGRSCHGAKARSTSLHRLVVQRIDRKAGYFDNTVQKASFLYKDVMGRKIIRQLLGMLLLDRLRVLQIYVLIQRTAKPYVQ